MSEIAIETIEDQNHIYDIFEKELELNILKAGSLLSIINNKKMNHVKLLLEILNNNEFKKCVELITEIDDYQYLVKQFIEKYPSICYSRVISNNIKKKQDDKQPRKRHL